MKFSLIFSILLLFSWIAGCTSVSEVATKTTMEKTDVSPMISTKPTSPSSKVSEAQAGSIIPPLSEYSKEKKDVPVEKTVQSSLQAGSHNDNEQFVRYLEYLELPMLAGLALPRLDVSERYIIQIKDSSGKPVPNCVLNFYGQDRTKTATFTTTSSGEVVLFIKEILRPEIGNQVNVIGNYRGHTFRHTFSRGPIQVIPITTDFSRDIPPSLPVDIVFLLDTTGSMGDEIQRLKDTLFSIHSRITKQEHLKANVRFGMVLYRDIGDEYLNKLEPLTESVEEFQRKLDQVQASGGGDMPEELDQALYRTITEQNWNQDGIRLVFLITDAPPHLNRPNPYNYIWSMKEAARRGIKIFTVGASGLNNVGEYVLRQIALFTQGHYIFLTYGERGESSDSPQAKVSHHTGANYEVMLLDNLIVRMIKKELSYLVDPALVMEEEIPDPVGINAYNLNERVMNLVEQLCYQIQKRLSQNPAIAVFPLQLDNSKRLSKVDRFVLDAAEQQLKKHGCKLLEREEIKKALSERMAASGAVLDEKELSRITQIQGADIFLSGRIYQMGESAVLFMQLVDVRSLEKLAVARVLWTPE